MGIHSQKMPASNSQFTQDVLKETETIFKDVPVKAMQIFMKYKAYYGKKNQRLKKKQSDFICALQPKSDQQGSKVPFTDFPCIGPYIIKMVLPNDNYLVRKIGTKKRK